MLYQIVGSGKTMFHAVDDTWCWRFRVGDRYFGRFWTQTVRFLARSKILGPEEGGDPDRCKRFYLRSQPIEIKVRFPNPADAPGSGEVAVEVEHKGHGSRRMILKGAAKDRSKFVRRSDPSGRRRGVQGPPAAAPGP